MLLLARLEATVVVPPPSSRAADDAAADAADAADDAARRAPPPRLSTAHADAFTESLPLFAKARSSADVARTSGEETVLSRSVSATVACRGWRRRLA